MIEKFKLRIGRWLPHFLLIPAIMVVLIPVVLIVVNSFKTKDSIFGRPFALPIGNDYSIAGYHTVFTESHFVLDFFNSTVVTLGSILLVVFFGAMASHALAEYKFKLNSFLALYLTLGIMVSIRLGSVGIIQLMKPLKLMNTLWALILVYTASGLPLTIFIMTNFLRQVPRELKDAARVDGANEYQVFWLILPLVRPALATVAVFTMLPIWNDLWFPLILAPSQQTRTVTFFIQQFVGEFSYDWQAILAGLTLAMVPVMIIYVIFSRQLLRGLTTGAVK
jgi:raffinose/stachyose/melibiose transport system permease protein